MAGRDQSQRSIGAYLCSRDRSSHLEAALEAQSCT
jgi:hypothetical protein